jgi:hypothetical protein
MSRHGRYEETPIMDHMLVTLRTSQWKWWLQEYENVTKLLCIFTSNSIGQKTYLSYK